MGQKTKRKERNFANKLKLHNLFVKLCNFDLIIEINDFPLLIINLFPITINTRALSQFILIYFKKN